MTLRGGLRSAAALILLLLQYHASSQTNPDSLFESAVSLQRGGRYDEALIRVKKLLGAHPEYDDARVLYGRLLAWQNDYESALSQLDSVLIRHPSNSDARLAKAQVLAWSGRFAASATLLSAMEKESPENPIYPGELGKVYLWSGNSDQALKEYKRAYQLDPRSVEAVRGIARAHRQMSAFNEARSWYRRLLVMVPEDQEAREETVRLAYRSTYELQIQGTYESFTKAGIKAHSVGQLELFASLNEAWKPFLHYSREEKFGLADHRFGAGTYFSPGFSLSFFFQGIVTPDAKVAPEVDLSTEVDAGVAGGLEALGGYRFLRFDSVSVHVLHPGLTYYFSGEIWLTASAYLGFTSINTTTDGWLLTCSYLISPQTTMRAGVFTGNEAFRATTLAELSTLRSDGGFLAAKTRVSESLAIDGLYQYTLHGTPSSSHLLTVTLAFLF